MNIFDAFTTDTLTNFDNREEIDALYLQYRKPHESLNQFLDAFDLDEGYYITSQADYVNALENWCERRNPGLAFA